MSGLLLRDAAPADLPALQAIYAGHVLAGTASFEETAPGLAEMGERLAAIQHAAVKTVEVQGLAFREINPFRPCSRPKAFLEVST